MKLLPFSNSGDPTQEEGTNARFLITSKTVETWSIQNEGHCMPILVKEVDVGSRGFEPRIASAPGWYP